jgi:hypothetical protein
VEKDCGPVSEMKSGMSHNDVLPLEKCNRHRNEKPEVAGSSGDGLVVPRTIITLESDTRSVRAGRARAAGIALR